MRRKLYTVDDAAAALERPPATIRKWLRGGKIDGYQVGPGGSWRISPGEIERLGGQMDTDERFGLSAASDGELGS